jgi:hypothetical protein
MEQREQGSIYWKIPPTPLGGKTERKEEKGKEKERKWEVKG